MIALVKERKFSYVRVVYAEKLAGEYITLKGANKIWVPDIFICNEKQSYDRMVVPDTHIRLYPNGTVLFSKRYVMVDKFLFILYFT